MVHMQTLGERADRQGEKKQKHCTMPKMGYDLCVWGK